MAPADGPDVRPDHHRVAESDSDLLGRIADGDVEAFTLLYGRYARPVFGLSLRRLRDRRHAERATQDAFAAIWRAAGTSGPAQGSRARWLFTVAEKTILGHLRPAARTQPDTGDGWLAFRVHVAVAQLPEQERVALELAYWSGRSKTEIADLLGLPLDHVEMRTRSALARLAVQLEELR